MEHISESKNEWQKTFDSISDLVLIHDHDHRIVRVNKPLQARLGLSYDEIKGENCSILEGIFYDHKKGCPHEKVINSKRLTQWMKLWGQKERHFLFLPIRFPMKRTIFLLAFMWQETFLCTESACGS